MTFSETLSIAIVTATLTALIVTPISAYLTAFLGLSKFRVEKWWEKRISAYEEIFECLHDCIEYYEREFERDALNRSYTSEFMQELATNSRQARTKIVKRQRMGSFVISERAVGILIRLEHQLGEQLRDETWPDRVDHNIYALNMALEELRKEARLDLGLKAALMGENLWGRIVHRARSRPGQPDLM